MSTRPSRLALILVTGIVLLVLPFVAPNQFVVHAVCIALVYAMLATSWDLLFGIAGQISFGHAGFFGLGAYTSALLTYHAKISPWLGLPLGGLAAALLGALVGLPSLRLRGVYLALATLAFSESLRIVATNWHGLTRGTLGFNEHPTFFRLSGETHLSYYLVLGVACAAIGVTHWIAHHSRLGLMFRAIRADDIRAQALGIDIVRGKVVAFALSGFFAGLAGALYAHFVGLVSPSELAPTITILVIAMATIGGVGTIIGPALAAVLIHLTTEALHLAGTVYNQVALGAVLIVFVLYLPDGVAGWLRRRAKARPATEIAK